MKINLRWPIVLLAFVLTVSSIYLVSYWRQQRLIEEPLKESLLQIEDVEDVDINKIGNETEFLVTLKEVDNIYQTYRNLEEILDSTYKDSSYKIALIDQRNLYLESIYAKIHFALMEGERVGNYSHMSKEISMLLEQESELENYRLWVDQKRIYLQLSSDNGFLYEIVPLQFVSGGNTFA
ncbi:MAG: hypothetical protein Q7J85_13730 [Bacillota bacterium]|nr:hypothetical protein [Bacillota bacterium]